jgi:PAS domain S-box-containing protein
MRLIVRRMRPLAILFWASLIIPAVVAAGAAVLSHRSVLEIAGLRVAQSATVLREHALRVFEAQEVAMRWVDQRIRGMAWADIEAAPEVRDLLDEIVRASPHIDAAWLVRPDGRPVVGTDVVPVPAAGIADRDDFRVLRQRDVLHLGGNLKAPAAGAITSNLSRRRSAPDGSFDGIIVIDGALSYFVEVWERAALGPNQTVAIVRTNGEILARYPSLQGSSATVPPDSPFFAAIRSGEIGIYEATSVADDVARIYGYAKLGDFPAYLLVGQDRTQIEAQSLSASLRIGGVALAITVVLLTTVLIAMRHDRRMHIEMRRRFEAEASLIGKSEHLAALQKVESALRRSEERFRTLFATLTQGVVYHDAEARIVSANRAAEAILGVPFEAMMNGRPDWQAVDANEAPLPDHQHPAYVALRTGRTVQGQLMGIRNPSAGERRWLMVDAIPQFRPGATVPDGVCTLFSDCTDRRRTEAAQSLLIREVDHRAKNAVALVLAVIKLTQARTIAEFVRKIEGRIGAVSRAHTLLSVSRWEGAEMGALVNQELAAFMDEGRRVAIDGPNLVLDAVAAQPVSMLLHELATNAAKHGALASPDGRLTVSWQRDGASDGLVLVWDEDGGPPVPADRPEGFGSLLIRSTVEAQLGGTIDLDWRPCGLRATLRLGVSVLAAALPSTTPATTRTGAATLATTRAAANGLRVLVVEGDETVGRELATTLFALGHAAVGPVRDLAAALAAVQAGTFDIAIVPLELDGVSTRPLAERLEARGMPFGYCVDGGADPDGWPDAPLIGRPATRAAVARLIAQMAERALGAAVA